MKLEQIASYLESKFPSLQFGSNLFINQMPSYAKTAIVLKDAVASAEIDGEAPPQRAGQFQLYAKGEDYLSLKNFAIDISDALSLYNHSLQDIYILMLRPLNEPQVKMLSNGSSCELCINFFIKYAIV